MSIVHNRIPATIRNRKTKVDDLHQIVTFPQNDQETFYLFTVTQTLDFDILKSFYDKRFGSTSFSLNREVVGYANFYRYKADPKEVIYLGNVIIDYKHRGLGYSKKMIEVMSIKAQNEFDATELRLAVFCNNTSAYALYIKMGFEVIDVEDRKNFHNEDECIFIMSKQLN